MNNKKYFGNNKNKIRLATFVLCASFVAFSCIKSDKNAFDIESSAKAEYANDGEKERSKESFDSISNKYFKELLSLDYVLLSKTVANKEKYGLEDVEAKFFEYSRENFTKYFKVFEELNKELSSIDKSYLDEKSKIDYEIIKAYADEKLKFKDYILYLEPLGLDNGIQESIPIFLSEFDIKTEEDINKYFAVLSSIDEYYAGIMEFEKEKADAGLFMSDSEYNLLLSSLDRYILVPKSNILANAFKSKLVNLGLSAEKIAEYENTHEEILENDFANAYEILKAGMEEIKNNEISALDIENLKEYREKQIKSFFDGLYNDIDTINIKLQESIADNTTKVSEIYQSDDINRETVDNYNLNIETVDTLIDFLKINLAKNFDKIDLYNYNVENIHGEFLSNKDIITRDVKFDEDVNIIYIKDNKLNTKVYEEVVRQVLPGDMYLLSYFRNNTDNPLRFLAVNDTFIKGWEVYSMSESYNADDRLNEKEKNYLSGKYILTLGVYAYLDLQINYYNFDKDFVSTYLKKHYNINDETAINNIYTNISARPLKYLQEYGSYMEIENLKETAKENYGEKFSSKDFNSLILELGPAPFDILKSYMNSRFLLEN